MNLFKRKSQQVDNKTDCSETPAAQSKHSRLLKKASLKIGVIGRSVSFTLKKIRNRISSAGAFFERKLAQLCAATKKVFAKDIVTINIEDSDLRYLITRGDQAKRWGSIPLTPGAVKDGLVLNYEALGTALDELVKAKIFKGKKVIVSLSGFQSVHRTIELPKMPNKLLSPAIKNEIKQTLPVSLEQLYLSWKKIGQENEVQRFFILGTPRSLLDSEIKSLHQFKIKPRELIAKPIALARLADCDKALIIDIESENCEIILIANGVPAIMRSIPTHSPYDPKERANLILQELERTLSYFETNYPDITLTRQVPMFLTGKLATDENLVRAISSNVGFEIKAVPSFLTHPADFPIAQYAVNVGLALKATAESGINREGKFLITDSNILPKEYLPKKLTANQALAVCGIMAGIAILIPLYQAGHSAANGISHLKVENSNLQQSCNVRQSRIKEAQQLQSDIADVNAKKQKLANILQDFQKVQQDRQNIYDLLCLTTSNAPTGVLPENVTLSSISEGNGSMDLNGTAPSYDVALIYANALRDTERFSNVNLTILSKSGEGENATATFNISLEWN